MFGIGKLKAAVAGLRARADRLEQAIAGRVEAEVTERLASRWAGVEARVGELLERAEADPERRARLLLNAVADELREKVDRALNDAEVVHAARADIEAATAAVTEAPRGMSFDEVHTASRTGFLAVWSQGRATDVVDLYVGFDDPPSHFVGQLNTRNVINSYIGTVIRKGERWIARSKHGGDVRCRFTPFL